MDEGNNQAMIRGIMGNVKRRDNEALNKESHGLPIPEVTKKQANVDLYLRFRNHGNLIRCCGHHDLTSALPAWRLVSLFTLT